MDSPADGSGQEAEGLSVMDAVSLFLSALQEAGLNPSESIVGDGKLHRFHDATDKHGRRDGWYVLHVDGIAAGRFGHWRLLPDGEGWCARAEHELSPEERLRIRERLNSNRTGREASEKKLKGDGLKRAQELWDNGTPAPQDHPYLVRKQVKPFRTRISGDGKLMVSAHDIASNFQGLQFIDVDGCKKFAYGTNKAGCYHSIGKLTGNTVLICEGYATGATLHEATGFPVAVAFDAGNLLPVAQKLSAKYQTLTIVVCADNDQFKNENVGVKSGRQAALAVGGLFCAPRFNDTTGNPTDFNDLRLKEGLEAVRSQVADAAPVAEGQWDEPLLFGDIETPDIPANILPTWLGDYAEAVARSTQTPPGLAVMFGLSVIATCLQRRYEVSPFGDEYREPMNLWTNTALEPGNRKTAVKNAMTFPLTVWERQQYEALQPEIADAKRRRSMNQKRIDKLMDRAAKEDSPEEREKIYQEIANIEQETPEEITAPQLWCDDVTPERLQGLLAEQNERMALISDEGGIFEIMAGLYSGGKANLNVFLQAHAGASVRVNRQGRDVFLSKPALTFGISVQPEIISALSSGNKSHFRGNGMLARFLYCLPKSLVGTRDIADRNPIPHATRQRYETGIYCLLDAPSGVDDQGNEQMRTLLLSDDARASWIAFSKDVENKQGTNGELSSFVDWTSKLPGAALRVAGNLHVVEHGQDALLISLATMERSLDLCRKLIIHMRAAFRLMGTDPATNDAIRVVRWIQAGRLLSFTRRECHKSLEGTFRNIERLLKALQLLEERNIITPPKEKRAKGNGTGRSSTYYEVNPAVIDS